MRQPQRRSVALWCIASLLSLVGANGLAACDEDDNPGQPATNDGSDSGQVSATDSGNGGPSPSDEDSAITPTDSGTKPETEASSPTINTTVGSTGWIRVADENVVADFFEDDQIVRASNASECVVYVRSLTKAFSPAGNLTVSTAGQTGGLALPIEILPGEADNEYFFPFDLDGLLFPRTGALTVQIEKAAKGAFPAMLVQSLKSPAFDKITVTAPPIPDAGKGINPTIPIPTDKAFNVTWTVPASAPADQRVFVSVFSMFPPTGATHKADLFCSWPLSAGTGSIPANLLADIKTRVGANASGNIHIYAGSQKEVIAGTASYLIEVSRPDSTSMAESFAQLH